MTLASTAYLLLSAFAGGVVGVAWGEYRGYLAAQRDFLYLRELLENRLRAGDLVLEALERGEKVTVIAGEGRNITNLWLKNPQELKPEDWKAIDATTRQIRGTPKPKDGRRRSR